MKQLFKLWCIAALLFVYGCSKEYDDSMLSGRMDNLENRVSKVEQLCQQMNTNISSLQTIISALQNSDYVTGVTPISKNGINIGYTITFVKSQPVTIYHGKDGEDGSDGKDGVAIIPKISIKKDIDGVYYWTLNGEWLLTDNGQKVKAEGVDGQDGVNGTDGTDGVNAVTPQLKIENGYWCVSYDEGASWTHLGRATGEDGEDGKDGEDGDSFFKSVDCPVLK